MRLIMLVVMLVLGLPVNAALVDNGAYTTDSVSGLDWLDLSATFDMTLSDAQAANSGWRLATDSEVNNLFSQLFPNFYETASNCNEFTNYCGISDSNNGASADQAARVDNFVLLFGAAYSTNPDLIVSRGLYRDDLNNLRYMGIIDEYSSNRVFGMDYTAILPEDISVSNIGTYLVRSSVVPIPAAVWLFGSALAGLGWMRRKQTV